ncbi:hypothetical protein GGI07_003771 [Coemansia sp. Benny D115]|nr:hypothetical protein GGI07_003771 [Coemansia sp. Benny D115]
MSAIYGNFSALIVGRRYYDSQTAPGEGVLLIREPRNIHDANAIAAYSRDRPSQKLGHLPRWLAAVLAPCMDKVGCVLEGVVAGVGSVFTTPINVFVYADPAKASVLSGMLNNYWHMWQLKSPVAVRVPVSVPSDGNDDEADIILSDIDDFDFDFDFDADFDLDCNTTGTGTGTGFSEWTGCSCSSASISSNMDGGRVPY